MNRITRTAVLTVAVAWATPTARTDVWDLGADNDNGPGTDNELVHGLDQVHDLGATGGGSISDQDWFRFNHGCNSSFEVILDGMTSGVSNGAGQPALDLLDSDGATVLLTSVPVSGFGIARRLANLCVSNATEPDVTNFVRVSLPSCGITCNSSSQYRVHFRDTTGGIPRFNNAGSQTSVLILQNSTDAVARIGWVAYGADGTVLFAFSDVFQPNQSKTYGLATTGGGVLAGKAGSLKVVSDASYGAVAGKVVAVEPATGFTFDTPLVYKPH